MSTPDSGEPLAELQPLRHSWLLVPHARLRVVKLGQLSTPRGVAFTAGVTLDGRPVGAIHNSGHGGATVFAPLDRAAFGRAELDEYVQASRTSRGALVTTEWVLEELITEYEGDRHIDRAATSNQLAVRRLVKRTIDLSPNTTVFDVSSLRTVPSDAARRHRTGLAGLLPAPESDQWWQVWTTDNGWTDVTTRPDDV
ncbi:hypothetical protein [Cryptosporangium sp. NPDC048952]|uniref:hypothetical protein n=1 Tax=Cryptosporangium sp. NPDC048952 TaxID=3363961 RepID=UPI00371907F1